jgi:hypothetical protein
MADTIEVTGRSKYEVAHQIALNILGQEKKPLERKEYLNTVVQAIEALSGVRQ